MIYDLIPLSGPEEMGEQQEILFFMLSFERQFYALMGPGRKVISKDKDLTFLGP